MIDMKDAAAEAWDCVVVGAGPAGCQAAVFAATEGLKTLVVEGDKIGGQIRNTPALENLLGFPFGLSGDMLAHDMEAQMRARNARICFSRVLGLHRIRGNLIAVHTSGDFEIKTRSVIVASGSTWKETETPGLRERVGINVHYGPDRTKYGNYEGKTTMVLGGGNSAAQGVLELAGRCKQVFVVARSLMKMSRYLIDRMQKADNITVFERCQVSWAEPADDGRLHMLLTNGECVLIDDAFVCGGMRPNTGFLRSSMALTDSGHIITTEGNVTSMKGVFACGDVRAGLFSSVASAIGDARPTVSAVHEYLTTNGPASSVN